MAEEHNGHGSPSRLDRIERAIEDVMNQHADIVVLHERLLAAQVRMIDVVFKRRPGQS